MALSDEEQRLLEQMEAALSADDPKLANALRGAGARTLLRKRALIAGLGFLVGVAALVAGMETFVAVSVVGFLVMLVSGVALLSSWQQVAQDAAGSPQARPRHTSDAFRDRPDEH